MLLGPIHFIRDSSLENIFTGVALCILLPTAMAFVFVKPFRAWKLVLAIVAFAVWLFTGIIGEGIGA